MTLNICLSHRTTPEMILQSAESLSSDQKHDLSKKLGENLLQTAISEYSDHSKITTNLPLRRGKLAISPGYPSGRYNVSFPGSIEVLDPDKTKVLLTLRRK